MGALYPAYKQRRKIDRGTGLRVARIRFEQVVTTGEIVDCLASSLTINAILSVSLAFSSLRLPA